LTAVDSTVMVLDAVAGSTQGSINSNPQPEKSPRVSCRQSGAAGPGDGSDARVGFGDGLRGATPARGDVRELARGGAVEGQYATRQIHRENQVYNRHQGLPPLPSGSKAMP
jgi:hypothetical protein